MTSVVVDTNVGVVANERHAGASPDCVIACVDALERIIRGNDRLVLDDEWEILREDQHNMASSGQPGPGDAFLKWALNNLANPQRCECVPIDRIAEGQYLPFPDDPSLASFDPSDRKFVAVALASESRPPILNAVDSDWWRAREALARAGVEVKFLCPDHVSRSRS